MNGLPDDALPEIHLSHRTDGPVEATLLKPLSSPAPAQIEVRDSDSGQVILCRTPLPCFGFMAVSWRSRRRGIR